MLTILKPSEIEVLSLAEVKAHLRLDQASEDDYLTTLIQAATQNIENYLGRSLISKTWQLLWNLTPGKEAELAEISLPCPPLLEVISVSKIFTNEYKIPIKRYFLDTACAIPKVTCAHVNGSIEVIYRAGYGDYPKHIPAAIRQAILFRVADFYENRTSACFEKKNEQESLVKELLAPYRQVGLI